MKKFITSILLAGSLALTGCGSDNDKFFNGGFQPPVAATPGFFVNSATGNDATGNFATGSRFATIQAALTAAPAGSDIIIEPGNYTGAINNVENGDRLLGSESTLLMGTATTRPVLTGPIVLADGNTVDFVRVANTPATVGAGDGNGDAIIGDGRNGGTITSCEIASPTDEGVSAIGVTGNWDISRNVISGTGPATATGLGIRLTTVGAGIARAIVNNNTITNSSNAGIGFTSSNTSQCNAQVNGNTLTGNQATVSFELIVGNTAVFCLDLENNTNDDVYVLSNSNTGSVVNVEQLTVGPPASIPSNTGNVQIDTGAGFANPTTQINGFCGF